MATLPNNVHDRNVHRNDQAGLLQLLLDAAKEQDKTVTNDAEIQNSAKPLNFSAQGKEVQAAVKTIASMPDVHVKTIEKKKSKENFIMHNRSTYEYLSSKEIKELIKYIKTLDSTKAYIGANGIYIRNISLSSQDAAALADALKNTRTIHSIILEDIVFDKNTIQGDVEKLAEIACNRSVTEFSLHRPRHFKEKFSDECPMYYKDEKLDFIAQDSECSMAIAKAFAKVIKTNPRLEALHISACGIGWKGRDLLWSALAGNKTLENFALEYFDLLFSAEEIAENAKRQIQGLPVHTSYLRGVTFGKP